MCFRKLLLLILLIPVICFSQKKINTKALDKKLEELREVTKTVGFSVAIVKGNEVIYAKGFGYSDLENKIKTNENTLFAIGSTTKAFTTALLGIMEEEKGLSFNDSPIKYLPELEFYNEKLNNEVTILDMVSHRTGLPRHDFSWYLFPTESKDSLLMRVKHHEPFTSLRQKWYYNNFMYLAQGLITEKLTNKSWEDNIRERFFTPLNMTTSNLSITEWQQHKNVAKGYGLEKFETPILMPYYNIAAMGAAGSINSSALEMANWLKVWINNGTFEGKQVLPETYVKKAINPLMLVGNGINDTNFPDQHLKSYGYAWFVSSYKGHYRLEHGGNIDGFSANVSFFPTDKIGIVVLANQNGSALPSLVRNTISDELLKLEKTNWDDHYKKQIKSLKESQKEANATAEAGRQTNTTLSHATIEYAGKYNHPGYGDFKIELKNDSLWATFKEHKMFLKHWNYDIFKPFMEQNGTIDVDSELGIFFNFSTDISGDIGAVAIKFEPTLEPILFKRNPLALELKESLIEEYVGAYEISGATLKVFNKDKKLTLLVPQQPEYKLLPIKENEFVVQGLSGYKVKFEKNEKGMFDLMLIQPNGTFKATKK